MQSKKEMSKSKMKLNSSSKQKEFEKFEEEIVREVKQDFLRRQEARRNLERQWQLNMNFVTGNQYCSITDVGEIEEYSKQYFWQEREVYNHIAPILESRIAKLGKVRPTLSVAPNSSSEIDVGSAKVSRKILNAIQHNLKLSEKIAEATNWSEICGTSFYKILWNSDCGEILGYTKENMPIKKGEVDISVCSPFEIFPDSSTTETVDDQTSIIHAKPYKISQIEKIWGISVLPESIDVLTLSNSNVAGGLGYTASVPKIMSERATDSAVVIEKYEKPSVEYPNGRVIVVAGNRLLAMGELPYINKAENKRGFPFIRQVSLPQPASFWGISVVERLIPVQRSYNAIKNRKHEFLNRIAMGILSVEDGSVDIESLEIEGLSPGKVLVYRQGSTPPKIMETNQLPTAFENEESKLLEEFSHIAGISDLSVARETYSSNMSGVALELLISQESDRLQTTIDSIKNALKEIGGQVLRLYKQFASAKRLGKIVDDNGEIELFYWNNSDISSDDVVLDTSSEIAETLSQKRNMIFELLNAGLLSDENGNISSITKQKILEMIGFGVWQDGNNITDLHAKKAGRENIEMLSQKEVSVLSVDDDDIHIKEHTAFLLSLSHAELKEKYDVIANLLISHIELHKERIAQKYSTEK
ncbi:MAG TPA: hypothetical protein DCO89_01380 [Clostridiales bacterium]|nr:hypothetical protein [Clostridiales bacterium]